MKSILFTLLLALTSCGLRVNPLDNQGTGGILGSWKATSVKDTLGSAVRICGDSIVRVEKQTVEPDPYIIIRQRSFTCSDGAFTVTRSENWLTEKNEKLYYEGSFVGTLTSTNLQVELNTATSNRRIQIYQKDGGYVYEESETGKSTTQATLTK